MCAVAVMLSSEPALGKFLFRAIKPWVHIAEPEVSMAAVQVSDIAIAVREGADAVMLSGETAFGKFPFKAVEVMGTVSKKTESSMLSYSVRTLTLCSRMLGVSLLLFLDMFLGRTHSIVFWRVRAGFAVYSFVLLILMPRQNLRNKICSGQAEVADSFPSPSFKRSEVA